LFVNLGYLYKGLKKLNKSLDQFQIALRILNELDSNNQMVSKVELNIGIILIAMGKPDAAFSHLQNARRISQEFIKDRMELGEIYFQMGNAKIEEK